MKTKHAGIEQFIRRFGWFVPLLVTLNIAWFGWYVEGEILLDIGTPTDSWYVHNFYDREQSAFLPNYRWSNDRSQINLPLVHPPLLITLTMAGGNDNVHLQINVDNVPHTPPFPIHTQLRHYSFIYDGQTPWSDIAQMTLVGDSYTVEADSRSILALVDTVGLHTLPGAKPPPFLPLLWLGLITGLIYLLLKILNTPEYITLALSTISGSGFALAWSLARLWVAPYLISLVLGLGVTFLILAGLHWNVRHYQRLALVDVISIFTACVTIIPLYTAIHFGWEHWHYPGNLLLLLLPLGLLLPCLREKPSGRVIIRLILFICVGYSAINLFIILRSDYATDFHAFYERVAGMTRDNEPLYNLEAIIRNPLGDTYKYPPAFALFFAPFTLLPFGPAIIAWRLFNLLLLAGNISLLMRAYAIPFRSWTTVGLMLILCTFQPLIDTLRYGQVDILLLLFIMAGLYALIRRQDMWWGIWIGVAAALKLYPAYLLGLIIMERRWRAFSAALITVMVLSGIALLFFGWANTWTFLSKVLTATGVGTTWVENQTFNGFLNRLLSPHHIALLPDTGSSVRFATYMWAIIITIITGWVTRPTGTMRPDIGYGLWIIAMLLILPAAWIHYETILIIPFFQAFVLAHNKAPDFRRPVLVGYALAWMLLAQGSLWTFFDRTLYGPFWQFILSYKFYGLLCLYCTTLFAGRHTRDNTLVEVLQHSLVPSSHPLAKVGWFHRQ